MLLVLCSAAAAQDRVIITNGAVTVPGKKKAPTSVPTEMVSYLGIATSPASAAIREQLKLPRGVGVVVERVEKESPAEAAGVRQYDIVEKFGDQLLVDGKQLAILVRLNAAGTSVPLTLIRQGERQQVNVTLSERLVPVAAEAFTLTTGDGVIESGTAIFSGQAGADATTNINDLIRQIKSKSASISVVNDQIYNIRKEDGKTMLRISDRDSNVLFEGPVDTEEDLAAVPAEYLPKVKPLMVKAKAMLGTR
jgi:hypothetical protein